MSHKVVPMIELISLILSCPLVTVKFMSLKKLQETNQFPIIGRQRGRGRITVSRFNKVNQKVQTLYKNHLKPVKHRITPLLLSIVEPKEIKNVESLEQHTKNF